jgi:hypothetical protein
MKGRRFEPRLEHLLKEDFFAKDMLQLFDFERFLSIEGFPSTRKRAASPGLASEIRQGVDDPSAPRP